MPDTTIAVILAGGLARRMGHVDKALIELDGKPLIEHVIATLQPQCDQLVINANGDAARFARLGLPVIADSIDEFPGPLAGVLAGMEWAIENRPDARWIVSVPADTPFAPENLVARFHNTIAQSTARVTCAQSNGRNHPVAGLWPVDLAKDLRHALVAENIRKVDVWTARHAFAPTRFESAGHDPFFNINRPQDIEQAEQILRKSTNATHPV